MLWPAVRGLGAKARELYYRFRRGPDRDADAPDWRDLVLGDTDDYRDWSELAPDGGVDVQAGLGDKPRFRTRMRDTLQGVAAGGILGAPLGLMVDDRETDRLQALYEMEVERGYRKSFDEFLDEFLGDR